MRRDPSEGGTANAAVLLDGCMVALGLWTVVFQFAVHLGVSRDIALGAWLLLALVAYWVGRSVHGVTRVAFDPARRSSVGLPLVGAAAVLAGILTFAEPSGRGWPLTWLVALLVFGAGVQRSLRRGEAGSGEEVHGTDSGAKGVPVAILVLALLAAVLSLVMVRPDRDDVYLMNRAAWVEEHAGEFPTRDTIFSDDVLPIQRPSGPQTAFEPLLGAVSARLPWSAAQVGYLGVAPLVAALAVVALWRLLVTLGARAPTLACWVGMAWLVVDGATHRSFGNFAMGRSWQGKVILLVLVVPTLWHHALAFGSSGRRMSLVLLGASSLAAVGLSSTAMLVVPPVVLIGVAAGAITQGRPLRLAASMAALLPPGIAAVWTIASEPQRLEALGPVLAFLDGIFSVDVEVEPATLVGAVFGDGVEAMVPLMAVGVGAIVLERAVGRLAMALAGLGVFGVAFAPGVLDIVSDVAGSESVLWRLLWILPVPALVGAAATAIPRLRLPGPLRQVEGLTAPVGVIVLVGLAGMPITCAANRGADLVWPPRLELPWPDQHSAAILADLAPEGSLVAGPGTVDFSVSVLTSRVKAANPRPHYLQGRHVGEDFHASSRLLLSRAMDGATTSADATALRQALQDLEPEALCHRPDAEAVVGTVLEQEGYERVDEDGFCVFWTR